MRRLCPSHLCIALVLAALSIWGLSLPIRQAHSASLSVSLSVGVTHFSIQGWTSPSSTVSLTENNAVIATALSGLDGSFTVSTTSDEGLHTFGISSVDTQGTSTATYTQTVSLTAGATTVVGNFVLAPAYSITDTTVSKGDSVHIHGTSLPQATIHIFIGTTEVTTQASSQGTWEVFVGTSDRDEGSYSVTVRAQTNTGYLSDNGTTYTVVIGPAPSPSPTVEQPSPLPTPSVRTIRSPRATPRLPSPSLTTIPSKKPRASTHAVSSEQPLSVSEIDQVRTIPFFSVAWIILLPLTLLFALNRSLLYWIRRKFVTPFLILIGVVRRRRRDDNN